MFQNRVILHVNGEPWTLAGLLLLGAGIILAMWLIALPIIARRIGTVEKMSAEEAAERTILGHVPSYDHATPILSGPAVGMRWNVTFSIGDLRRWRNEGRMVQFYALPLYVMSLSLVFALGGVAGSMFTGEWIFLLFTGGALLLVLVYVFMMWAAVHTELE